MKTPKQNIYGGVIYYPSHKFSDMHGLLRCVIRAKGPKRVIELMARFGIDLLPRDFGRTWSLSKSVVEEMATHGHSHEPLVCPFPIAYLKPEFYEPLRRPAKSPDPVRILPGRRDTAREREFFGLERENLKPDLPGRR